MGTGTDPLTVLGGWGSGGTGEWQEMGEGWAGEFSGRWDMSCCFQGWKTVCFLAMILSNLESCDMLFPFQFSFKTLAPSRESLNF